MMESKTQAVARVVPKEQLAFMKDDKGFTDYLIKDLSQNLFEAVMGELEKGERIVKLSDLRVSEVLETQMVEYRKYIKFTDLVRCKDCKHRENREWDSPCPCVCADSWYSWMPEDDWFCANGERKEE